jgi:hypothetical protein
MVGGFLQLLQERAPADDAAHPFLIERRIALHRQNEVAVVLLDGLLNDRLGLMPGGGHDRVVIIQEIIERITSLASGWPERMKLSEQQVHSSPCSHSTGMRGLVSIAVWIWAAAAGGRPSAAAVRLQNLVKLRRVMP